VDKRNENKKKKGRTKQKQKTAKEELLSPAHLLTFSLNPSRASALLVQLSTVSPTCFFQ